MLLVLPFFIPIRAEHVWREGRAQDYLKQAALPRDLWHRGAGKSHGCQLLATAMVLRRYGRLLEERPQDRGQIHRNGAGCSLAHKLRKCRKYKYFPGSFCHTFLKLKAFIYFPLDSLQEGSPRVQEERSGAVAEEVESRASVINRNHRKENSHGSTEWTLRSNKSFFRGGIKTLHNFFYTRPLLMEASATLCATIWHTQKER